MKAKIQEELKERLEKRKKEILNGLESVGHQVRDGKNPDFDANFPDYGDSAEDNAIEVADYSKNLSFEKDLEKELAEINQALEGIVRGDYGRCQLCGREISLNRLRARPQSAVCLECKKSKSEKSP